MIAFLACLKVGIVAVPVFPPNPARRDTLHMFSKITESSGSVHALTSQEYNHMKKLASVKDAITKFKRKVDGWPEKLKWIITTTTTNSSKAANNKNTQQQSPDGDELAFLQYTSGSTSEPKGVMITHANLAHNLTIITNELKAKSDTIVVSWLPQYHDMGLIGSYLGVLYCGGSGYYLSPLTFLQRPMIWIEAVSKYRATHLQAPNFAFKLTSRKFQPANYVNKPLKLQSVRHIINAAEPVDEDSIKSFESSFGPFGLKKVIFPTYGLAEHTVFVCSGGEQIIGVDKEKLEKDGAVVLVEGETDDTKKNTESGEGSTTNTPTISRLVGCGYPSRQKVDVRIVDRESREEQPQGRVGEIWINSPSKAMGYFRKGVETKEDFHAQINGGKHDGSTYLRTGDLGFLHNNELFICGRLKDLIIIAGRNYYPQDIEATAEATSPTLIRPGCSAAFTIDPTHDGGEEVALVMELKEVPSSAAEAESVCNKLANDVRGAITQEHSLGISQIVFLKTKTVPKTTSGKIARAWCRKGFLAGTLQAVYKKSFKDQTSTFEIEPGDGGGLSGGGTASSSNAPLSKAKINEIRNMSKEDILDKLRTDVSRIAQIPPDSFDTDTALVTILDSLSISQFKGRLENVYGVQISDEYLFGETTTLQKLAEVVKLGYAPDDNGEGGGGNGVGGANGSAGPSANVPQGTAGGIAGALGCPPGVVCCVIQ